jgi:hypothetical protein
MYISTWIIVLIIVIFSYLIYKRRKPSEISKTEVKENMQAEMERKQEALLKKIKTSHLKDYMETETDLLECGKNNFIRLSERFKHDDIKLEQVIKDWIDYIDILSDAVYESEMLDVSSSETSQTHYKAREALYIKLQEIIKRFKDLLGADYSDFEELKKLRIIESNKLYEKMHNK